MFVIQQIFLPLRRDIHKNTVVFSTTVQQTKTIMNTPLMKNIAATIAALGLLAAGASAQTLATPVTAKNIKLSKISPAVLSTPEYNVSIANKRSEALKWFEIEVEFEVKDVELVDELTFQYTVLLNGKLCPGEVTHVNIPKGNNRYSVMYISPRSLDRITGGKALNAGMIDNIWVKVSKSGQLLGETSMKKAPLPNLPQMPDQLVKKSDTPFQVLWWDRYEAVKATGR